MRRADTGNRRINKTKNIIICFAIIAALFFLGLGFARSGDMFLAFIGNKTHVNIDYKNRSGFVSCFLLRVIRLKNPVFALKDCDFTLECQNAIIRPGFDRLAEKKQIILDCHFENASFLGSAKKLKTEKPARLLQGNTSLLVERLSGLVFHDIHAELIIYGETVEFPYCLASAKDVKLYASGHITESGDFKIKAKIFFSPEIAGEFPEEFRALFAEEPKGWASYYLHAESGNDRSSFKFETDTLSIDFERLEVK